MISSNSSLDSYERILIVSFLLFVKSLQLYGELGTRAVIDPKIIRQRKIQEGLKNLQTTLESCGNSLERLPTPPAGAEPVDKQIRTLGKEIVNFSRLLIELTDLSRDDDRKSIVDQIQKQLAAFKKDFRAAIEGYEAIYPGHLSHVLQVVQA